LLLKVMKPVIQKVLEKQIKDAIEKADAFAYGIHKDARKAIDAAKDDPENAPNIFQQYVNAYQESMTAKKEKAKEATSNTNVKMAITKEDSMFKNISLPGGISTKATEYKQLAAKGDKWESPIFSIGSAKESSNIPKIAPVQRKPHSTATGTVRGGNHPNSEGNYGSSGNTGTSGYGGAGTTGTGASNQGFSNQVDQAFGRQNNGMTNGSANMTNGSANGKTYYDGVTQ